MQAKQHKTAERKAYRAQKRIKIKKANKKQM
jgi:hypothetical protein